MQIDRQILDDVFLPFFEGKAVGDEIALTELNWLYDYKQRCGAPAKEEAEYVINTQISRGCLEVVSPSSLKISSEPNIEARYTITNEAISNAANAYSEEFWKKLRAIKNT